MVELVGIIGARRQSEEGMRRFLCWRTLALQQQNFGVDLRLSQRARKRKTRVGEKVSIYMSQALA
jgi:hypothetical protein